MAIFLPEELKERLHFLSEEISKGASAKLVEKQNLHLTLLFIGEIDAFDLKKIKKIIKENLISGKIKLSLGKVSLFGKKSKPEGVWVEVGGEKEKLFRLYKKLVDSFLKNGFLLREKIEFTPHVTLYRFKKGVNKPPFLDLKLDFEVRVLSLYQSVLTAQGPVYTKLADFELK